MKMKNFDKVAACDMNSIVAVIRNNEGKTTVTSLGMYSLAEKVWYIPSVAPTQLLSEYNGLDEDCEPIITRMTRDDIAATLNELDVQQVDRISTFTPDGIYAVKF